jgi:hypothetical protein
VRAGGIDGPPGFLCDQVGVDGRGGLPEHHGDVMENFASTLADLANWRYGR